MSPVSDEAPCGVDLEYDPEFVVLGAKVVWQWVENPYWQVFTGETYLQTEPPVDPSSLTRWRKRLDEAGIEELLAETIEAAKRAGVVKALSVKRVIVDTTVMQKAIAHPTDLPWNFRTS